MHKIIEELSSLLKHTIDKRIDVSTAFNATNSLVAADGTMVHSALLNLALNARDAMSEGGTIKIETSNSQDGQFLCIDMIDSGCGIDPVILPRVFEPFFTTKEVGKGTGLGLAAVFGTIEGHGGTIEVSSIAGKGTTFHIKLPVTSKAPIIEAPPLVWNDIKGSGSILIVDDEEDIRQSMHLFLEELGYKITEDNNGRNAVNRIVNANEKFDLILMDIVMPEMNGIDAIEAITKHWLKPIFL